MQCPAVAITRLARFEADRDTVLVWVECHDEHRLGIISGRALQQVRAQTTVDQPISLPMQSVAAIDPEEINRRRNAIEAHLMSLGAEMDVYERFLAEGGPKNAPSSDEPSEVET